jgi:hypothetical protein
MKPTAAQLRQLKRDNARWPERLADLPRDQWPALPPGFQPRLAVFRSRCFLVQVVDQGGQLRLSVNRTEWDERRGSWREDISWDDLQRLKAEAGFGDWWAVEVFPPDAEVVNVANMRHIFLLDEAPAFAWIRERKAA